MPASPPEKHLLIVGASRGLGYALAEEYLSRNWHVVGTVRGKATNLHQLTATSAGRLDRHARGHVLRAGKHRQ